MRNQNQNINAAELLAAIRDGDEGAFAQFYGDTYERLVALTRRITGDIEEARNIAHDAFTRLWEQREQIDRILSPDGFIKAVAANAARNFVKRQRVHAKYVSEELNTGDDEDHAADSDVISHQTARLIETVIEAMPPQRRKVYVLGKIEGLTYKEIAERLGISPGTVHRHMKIALDEMRDAIPLLWLLSFLELSRSL